MPKYLPTGGSDVCHVSLRELVLTAQHSHAYDPLAGGARYGIHIHKFLRQGFSDHLQKFSRAILMESAVNTAADLIPTPVGALAWIRSGTQRIHITVKEEVKVTYLKFQGVSSLEPRTVIP